VTWTRLWFVSHVRVGLVRVGVWSLEPGMEWPASKLAGFPNPGALVLLPVRGLVPWVPKRRNPLSREALMREPLSWLGEDFPLLSWVHVCGVGLPAFCWARVARLGSVGSLTLGVPGATIVLHLLLVHPELQVALVNHIYTTAKNVLEP